MMRFLRLVLAIGALLALTLLARQWPSVVSSADAPYGVDALSLSFERPAEELVGTTLSIGLLLLGSWLFGRAFKAVHLPKLSGYLVFGMLVGPEALGVIPGEQLPSLKLVENLAIALIALTAGGEIEIAYLKRSAKLIGAVAALQLSFVLLSITAVVYLLAPSIGLAAADDTMMRLLTATLVSAIATAASPAVYLAVVNELRAHGPTVQAGLAVMISKDLILIVLFTIVISIGSAVVQRPSPDGSGAMSSQTQLGDSSGESRGEEGNQDAKAALFDETDQSLAPSAPASPVTIGALAGALSGHLLGSVLAGIIFGLGFAWYMHAIRAHLAIFIVLGCMSIALVSDLLALESLIVALIAGVLMRNIWRERVGPFFHTMEDLSLPVYCVFFAVAGAKLQLGALAVLWPAALLIAVMRLIAIWASTNLGCRFAGQGAPMRTWLWTAFVPQAGVSVALISIVAATFADQPFAELLYSLVLATIALHELLGPLLLKFGLQRVSVAEQAANASATHHAANPTG